MSTFPGFPVFNGYAPTEGPRALAVDLDHSVKTSIDIDLYREETAGIINVIQSVWVDNSNNDFPLTLTFQGTGQRLVIPATAQGLWPVIAPEKPSFNSASSGGVDVTIILLNVPMPMMQFGPVNVTVPVATGTFTNRGIELDTGGVSEQIMAADITRKRIIIQNPPSEFESLFINFGAAATDNSATIDSIELAPGETFDSASGPVSTETVNVIAATTSHKIIAKEM